MMDRETWLRCILDSTRDLADERYQERVWVHGQGPEVDSSTEAVARLLEDYDLPGFLDQASDQRWLSGDELAALQALETALEHQADRGDVGGKDAARISSPEWRGLRSLASRTLQTFTARETSV